jgi:NADPH-dependent curcumin reductase CurA
VSLINSRRKRSPIDIFFDNVGGDILDTALARLAMRGPVVP